jgi:long-chain acyl-CoA synthetase
VRRGLISERYGMLVDAFYNNKNHCFIETEVTFEDGRKGAISADLKIKDMNIYDLRDQVA